MKVTITISQRVPIYAGSNLDLAAYPDIVLEMKLEGLQEAQGRRLFEDGVQLNTHSGCVSGRMCPIAVDRDGGNCREAVSYLLPVCTERCRTARQLFVKIPNPR